MKSKKASLVVLTSCRKKYGGTFTTLRSKINKNNTSINQHQYSSSANDDGMTGVHMADIVQGPSLVRTSLSKLYRPNPTLLHLPGLRSLPYWSQYDTSTKQNRIAYQEPEVSAAVQLLEENYNGMLEEYVRVSKGFPSDYEVDTEHKLHHGQWDWHSYMLKGKLQGHFVQHYPFTVSVLQKLRDTGTLFEGTPFGYTFFSTLHPNTTIQPHNAPMNLRLRIHVPLLVPPIEENNNTHQKTTNSSRPSCGIRVGSTVRQWHVGNALVLDDAYEHEVWNHTDCTRVLLLVDIWHPDITPPERTDIIRMFQHAQQQGWLL